MTDRRTTLVVYWAALSLACGRTSLTGSDAPTEVTDDTPTVPVGMVELEEPSGRTYWIDAYEASVEDTGDWGSADQDQDDDGRIADQEVAARHAVSHGFVYDDDGGESGVVMTTKKARSVSGVLPSEPSYYQAAAACTRAGKRLCTGAEWLHACGNGAAQTKYPYGAAFDGGDTVGVDCWTSSLATTVKPTGSASACRTSNGIFDLSGNVVEWVDYGGPTTATKRGGNISSVAVNASCVSTLPHTPATAFSGTGFRCCWEP